MASGITLKSTAEASVPTPASGKKTLFLDSDASDAASLKDSSGTVTTIAAAAGAYVAGGTDVAVTDGGTGSSTASGARTNLGLGTMAVEAKTITTQDDLLVGGSAGALARLGKGTDGQVLTVDPTTHHLLWATPASGFSDPMTTRGDVIVRNSSNATARLGKGAADTFLHSDGTDVAYAAVTDAMLSTSDITTNNASTSKHGFAPKYPNDATKYLDGTGAYSVPSGGGGGSLPVGVQIVPPLFAASYMGYTVSDSEHFSSAPAWNAFANTAGVPAHLTNGWLTNGSSLPQYMQVHLPAAVVATHYALSPWSADNFPGRCATAWTFYGSNDGSSWTSLDAQSGITLVSWTPSGYAFSNSTAYAYYRLTITAVNTGPYTGLGFLGIYS